MAFMPLWLSHVHLLAAPNKKMVACLSLGKHSFALALFCFYSEQVENITHVKACSREKPSFSFI